MIYGIGIDLVDVSRMQAILGKWQGRFRDRIFSAYEIDYCETKKVPAVHYAARFAVKEAFLKCLGMGLWSGLALKDIEVVNGPDGAPSIKLHRRPQAELEKIGSPSTHVSISHTDTHATAIVILEKK